ncbi:MAG: 50S ribosomal protein L22 [Candidatus Peribacteraceae bacterium]
MHAHLSSARLAPKKANLMAKMVRGLSVPDAVELLRKTSKKSARLFEGVLRSAMANAEHTFKQDPQMLVLKTVIVNQGTAYRRGIPMARGRVRPIRKFLSHISITLGFPEAKKNQESRTRPDDPARLKSTLRTSTKLWDKK